MVVVLVVVVVVVVGKLHRPYLGKKKNINHPHDNLSFNMSSKSMGLPISRKLFGLGQERWKTKKKMIVKRLNRKQIKNATHA